MKILVGFEESQAVTKELRALGHEAYSCDFLECSGGYPEWHIRKDVFGLLDGGWDAGIFFPPCTYLTCSAEWAYKDGPYHQKVKPETLTGKARREARMKAIEDVKRLWGCTIPKVAIENPVGKLSSWRKPDQCIHPYMFGNDASKKTCLWLRGFPKLEPTSYVEPRVVDGKKRWGNQTGSGQNKLTPANNRARLRSKTYPGIAKAIALQWFKNN